MKNKDTYKNKTQNMFTAYVVRSVKGARMKYMDKKNYRESMENHLEDDAEYEPMIHFDDYYEAVRRERLLENKNREDTLNLKNCRMISSLRQSDCFRKKKGILSFSMYFNRNHLIK